MKKLIFALFIMPCLSHGAWQGKLNLAVNESQPIMLRELNDGQWLFGVSKPDIFHVDRNGAQWFHAGVFQAWNAEKLNPTFFVQPF